MNADRAVSGALGGAPVERLAARRSPARRARASRWARPRAPGTRAGTSYAYALAALVRQRRDLDDDRRRDRLDLHPGRVGHRRAAARHRHRHQPVRRRERDLGRRSARSPRARPVNTGRAGDQRHAAPRPDAHGQRGLEPGRHDLHVPVAALGRRRRHLDARSAPAPPASRSRPPSAAPQVRVTVTATNAYGQASATSDPVGPVVCDPPVNTDAADDQPAPAAADVHADRDARAPGTARATPYRYQWQRDDGSGWTAIAGATTSTLPARQGRRGRARARARDGHQRRTAASSARATRPPLPVAPVPARQHRRPGDHRHAAARPRSLTATRGTWTGPDNMYALPVAARLRRGLRRHRRRDRRAPTR